MKNIDCAYCGMEIEIDPISGWADGNNGLPLVDGRVCSICNLLVIRKRLERSVISTNKDEK
jgi:hypothetical protein